MHPVVLIVLGMIVGTIAGVTGLAGGFIIVPILLLLGYQPEKSVGTSFIAVFIISLSALLAYARFHEVDYKVGLLIGIGGVIGTQIGVQIVDFLPADVFKKIIATLLLIFVIRLVV